MLQKVSVGMDNDNASRSAMGLLKLQKPSTRLGLVSRIFLLISSPLPNRHPFELTEGEGSIFREEY